ncbi:hypothetical protein FRB91_003316 [Serendipita sp. 411]|nr:hypothetical protein FRC18_011102 [Serendipita sp. 400]KAG8824487.1 hypothetical protein FRC19_001691 [Serendipita sp. 401]KAG8843496.1 hypothetical protein FRB91_003316 [Serendipita sp. 411]KAG8870282.1 hypothetical protein FRC20_012074 [Serendipita sp. 405]KAG9055421.1 hypothetical protein FS842_002231 [Serendipita sp. 407]
MLATRLVSSNGRLQVVQRGSRLVLVRGIFDRRLQQTAPACLSNARYFAHSALRCKTMLTRLPEHKEEEDGEEAGRRAIDNNNPNPVISLPGGIAWPFSNSSAMDAALTTLVGLGLVFLGGVAYVSWYKWRVLDKIEEAFAKGYDPALELATHVHSGKGDDPDLSYAEIENMRRKEQGRVDSIISGQEVGHYYLMIGPKGTGKSTMILEAMKAIEAEGVSVCEAHPDLEVFRLRLGKALNFEYNEDTQTGLFQRRDPREGGPALDIERAFNKLEKVALRCNKKNGRPLVLIINNVHLFPNDASGKNMLLQIQQRAESWSESGILTIVFTSDDVWPYLSLRKTANRMQVLSIADLDYPSSMYALRKLRKLTPWKEGDTPETLSNTASIIGGRLSYINKVSRVRDMVDMAKALLEQEKAWLQSLIGLIKDCDDDVMDEQKWSACTWLLLQEFVKMRVEQEKERDERIAAHKAAGKLGDQILEGALPLPVIPYHRCRTLMTRTDFMEELDRINIITIDTEMGVRPDSMLILQAAREVVQEDGFDELLQSVRDRIDEIESLHRTRELTFKDLGEGDLIRLAVDKNGSRRLEMDSRPI